LIALFPSHSAPDLLFAVLPPESTCTCCCELGAVLALRSSRRLPPASPHPLLLSTPSLQGKLWDKAKQFASTYMPTRKDFVEKAANEDLADRGKVCC
jgi:hypothetical protein